MENLLDETLDILNLYKVSEKDIMYVCDNDHWCTWDHFSEQARNFYYEKDYNSHKINPDLIIVGKDFILFRNSILGLEMWSYLSLKATLENQGDLCLSN